MICQILFNLQRFPQIHYKVKQNKFLINNVFFLLLDFKNKNLKICFNDQSRFCQIWPNVKKLLTNIIKGESSKSHTFL